MPNLEVIPRPRKVILAFVSVGEGEDLSLEDFLVSEPDQSLETELLTEESESLPSSDESLGSTKFRARKILVGTDSCLLKMTRKNKNSKKYHTLFKFRLL